MRFPKPIVRGNLIYQVLDPAHHERFLPDKSFMMSCVLINVFFHDELQDEPLTLIGAHQKTLVNLDIALGLVDNEL